MFSKMCLVINRFVRAFCKSRLPYLFIPLIRKWGETEENQYSEHIRNLKTQISLCTPTVWYFPLLSTSNTLNVSKTRMFSAAPDLDLYRLLLLTVRILELRLIRQFSINVLWRIFQLCKSYEQTLCRSLVMLPGLSVNLSISEAFR